MRQHEAADAPGDLGVARAPRDVAGEELEQEPAVHGRGVWRTRLTIAAGLRLPNGVEASRRAGVRSRASRHGRAGA
jgi:hypothetical protein